MTKAVEETRNALLRAFPGSFINPQNEFIAHPRTNQYIILQGCKTPEEIEAKVLEWFSRPAHKTAPYSQEWRNRKFHEFMRVGVNNFLDTEFSEDDMAVIYQRLGNAIHHDLTMQFISCGMDIEWLRGGSAMSTKPILFNTDEVRATRNGAKTATRRVVKPQPPATAHVAKVRYSWCWSWWEDSDSHQMRPPYHPGDILYVREAFLPLLGDYVYRASVSQPDRWKGLWRPSIHMPREAARIFLRVTDVRVERIKDATESDAKAEGFSSRAEFIEAILKMYPDCTENSWMWVIEFERISREEAMKYGS